MPVQIDVKVTPRASRSRIEVGADGAIKVYVTAPPTDGEANKAVCELVAKSLGVPKPSVQVASGHSSRQKRLEIASADAAKEDIIDRLRIQKRLAE
jgi:uncharacterized protein (TIGR00251 family)